MNITTMLNLPKFKLKKDSYQKKRGASKILIIFCGQCSDYIMTYQKDGPGPLLRCYLDRIHHPEYLSELQNLEFSKKTFSVLSCRACTALIGTPIVYEKENRPAYHMRPGLFALRSINSKKVVFQNEDSFILKK